MNGSDNTIVRKLNMKLLSKEECLNTSIACTANFFNNGTEAGKHFTLVFSVRDKLNLCCCLGGALIKTLQRVGFVALGKGVTRSDLCFACITCPIVFTKANSTYDNIGKNVFFFHHQVLLGLLHLYHLFL